VNTSLITKRELDKARRDLEDATSSLATYWIIPDDRDAIGRIATAAESLMRAIASIALRRSV
jgi:hypothetical protein